MGILSLLFGAKGSAVSGSVPPVPQVATGRGFTFNIVGESRFQKHLSGICGGKREEGHKHETSARLRFERNPHDANAIAVDIDGKQVGWVPSELAGQMRQEITALSHSGVVVCKAKIVGGWDKDGYEGSFGVKLSLSRPLKLAKP